MAMRVPDNIPTTQTVFGREGDAPYMSVPAANPEAFGGMAARAISGMGQTLEQAGEQTSQTVLVRQQFANESSSNGAGNTAQTNGDDLINGNPEKGIVGFTTLQGKAAIDAYPQYVQKVQQAYEEQRASLNPAAQRMFDYTTRWALRGALNRMGEHYAQQQVDYNYREARGSVSVSQQTALNGADDPDTWNSGLAAVQEASLRGSKIMGLDGDAAEARRQADLSDLYIDRARQLEGRDPVAAQKFYQDNIGMFAPEKRYALERELDFTTSARYAATDGSTAFANATGRMPPGALPQNYNADTVKPYTDQQISNIVAQVKAPSQYDATINTVATKYGIDSTDLKMRLVAESGLNPNAVSSQGARGIAQITPDTAKTLGVDPMNPDQAIDGAARLIVRAQSGNTTDRSAIDRAYYGGSVGAQGPNTDQYVANLGAVRNRLYGPNAGAPLTADELEAKASDVDAQARALAEARKPGDPVYADRVAAEADKNLNRQIQQVREQDYANMTSVLGAVVKSGLQSPGELPPELQQTYAHLTPQDQLSVGKVMQDQQRAASGEFTPSDPKVFNDAQSRINLPAGDPNRLTDPSQITPLIAHGLSFSDANRLIGEMKDLNSPETNPFMKQVNQAKQTAQRMLTTSVNDVTIQYPEAAAEAAYRFGYALDDQIAAYRKAGKNPQTLFDPNSPDYVLSPPRVLLFMPTEAEIVAEKARSNALAAPKPAGGPAVPQRLPGESPGAYLARVGVAAGGGQ